MNPFKLLAALALAMVLSAIVIVSTMNPRPAQADVAGIVSTSHPIGHESDKALVQPVDHMPEAIALTKGVAIDCDKTVPMVIGVNVRRSEELAQGAINDAWQHLGEGIARIASGDRTKAQAIIDTINLARSLDVEQRKLDKEIHERFPLPADVALVASNGMWIKK